MSEELLPVLEEISAESSTNGKLEILKQNKDNEALSEAFYYAFNPHIRFYLQEKSIPVVDSHGTLVLDGENIKSLLEPLYSRSVTGAAAKGFLAAIFESLTEESALVLKRIVLKDLKCNVSQKGANKVWKKLIPEFGYMRCSGPNKESNIVYPAIVQTKADGAFCNVVIRNGVVEFLTRNGTPFELPSLAEEFQKMGLSNKVFNGELVVVRDGKVLDRKTGNGMVNKIIKRDQQRTSFEEKYEKASDAQKIKLLKKQNEHEEFLQDIEKDIIIEMWDVVNLNEWESGHEDEKYVVRLSALRLLVESINSDKIKMIETAFVNDKKEAQDFYDRMISEGKEGAVLKNMDMPWKNGTSTQQIKMKQVLDCDLEIVDWYPGKKESAFKDGIGGFKLRSSCGQLEVNVGSGLTREQRGLEPINPDNIGDGLKAIDGFDFNQYTGKIAAIEYNELINSKGKDTWSLFLPIIVEVREDKTEADSLEKVKS